MGSSDLYFNKEIMEMYEKCNQDMFDEVDDIEDRIDRALLWQIEKGNKRAFELFLMKKEKYLKSMISRDYEIMAYKNRGLDDEDLYQTAILGVIDAVKKFDFRIGIKVNTFISNYAKYSIKNFFRKYGSVSIAREAGIIYSKFCEYLDIVEDKPSLDKVKLISKKLGIEESKIVESFMAVKMRNNSLSIKVDGDIEADKNLLKKYAVCLVQEFAEREELFITMYDIKEAMKQLNERERFIIENIFIDDRTQKEVSEKLGCSTAAVGKVKKRALEKLREILGKDGYDN